MVEERRKLQRRVRVTEPGVLASDYADTSSDKKSEKLFPRKDKVSDGR